MRRGPALLLVGWAVLLILAACGDGMAAIRDTVRVALLSYLIALNLMLGLGPAGWRGATPRGRLARWAWLLGWLAFLVHLRSAFAFFHGWSHAHAVEHTRAVSGFGEGIYVSHLFTLLWGIDAVWWWAWPNGYAARPRWLGGVLHGFMLFIVFNGTIVYESGAIRWMAAMGLAELALAYRYRRSFLIHDQ